MAAVERPGKKAHRPHLLVAEAPPTQEIYHRKGQFRSLNINTNDLPSPTRVAGLLRSLNISRVKLYDADRNVLTAFHDTDAEFVIGIGNEKVSRMTDPGEALAWLQLHVLPYLPYTNITCVTVGNEVFKGNDTLLISNLLPAMRSVHQALVSLRLDKKDLAPYVQPILGFHSVTRSPFFAYKENPSTIPLDYVMFEPNSGVTDPNTNLNYDNMLYAQIDAVYSAMTAWGHTNIEVRISETGWPSKGDDDEVGASPENAAKYNGNLLQRIAMNQGTPLKPSIPVDVFVFALFNENLKPGPTSERNYGLFYPDGTPVYDVGLRGHLPSIAFSSCSLVSMRATFFISSQMMPALSFRFDAKCHILHLLADDACFEHCDDTRGGSFDLNLKPHFCN
ncbi:hypothetical protein B296_00003752 [Ensete ventricosum]|uniref:Glucan endo-1,3-beta-D-glucosidase n=1 Tax=Ensete ventricosum TaxID=4639 RepID=A0A427AE79_ENSVE|nr:hypothetical protein B296_00003752 [Ensete ventricosum]